MRGLSLGLSWSRFVAVLRKEFLQMRRDRMTVGLVLGVPLMQLMLFGFAINMDPKHLPTAVHIADSGIYARDITAALQNSGYFEIVRHAETRQEASALLDTGEVAFSLEIPEDFTRKLMRGERPQILIEADASDPSAASNAIATIETLAQSALKHDLVGPLAQDKAQPAFDTIVQRRYNPEGITQYNIVPGLMAVILTMSMVMVTSMAMTRETERGTLENLLAMPARPIEVMLGKIVPYIAIGYAQVSVILVVAHFMFAVPMIGSLILLLATAGLFIAANLAVGFTFSTFAGNQLQAMQMTVFFLLPSILLSGFAFPFRGMPVWAQWIGEALPLTHFLRIVRGIMLKGNGAGDMWVDIAGITAFVAVAVAVALARFRQTLD
jgi:ABC-2 type transport system permease protein